MARNRGRSNVTANTPSSGGGGRGDSRVLSSGGRPSPRSEFEKDGNNSKRVNVVDRVKNERRR